MGSARAPERDAPERANEALARARVHARRSLAEAARCASALLDAGALSTGGRSARDTRGLSSIAQLLDEFARSLGHDGGAAGGDLAQAVLEALDAEIARWDLRSRDDADARAVWRAFVGLREILWEFGVRPGSHEEGDETRPRAAASPRPPGAARPRPRSARVQRVRVQRASGRD